MVTFLLLFLFINEITIFLALIAQLKFNIFEIFFHQYFILAEILQVILFLII